MTITRPGRTADQAGRALAAWAVAHGTGFSVSTVGVGAERWTDHGWGTGTGLPTGTVTIATS